jgi:superfamily II DNA helicase RecQ
MAVGGCVLVGTAAVGVGVDYEFVSHVVHIGGSYSLIDYCQEVGRGGRGDGVCSSDIFTNTEYFQSMKNQDEGLVEFGRWIQQSKECRMFELGKLLDAKGFRCSDYCQNGVYCDFCEKGRLN